MLDTIAISPFEATKTEPFLNIPPEKLISKRILLVGYSASYITYNLNMQGYETSVVDNVHEAKRILFAGLFENQKNLPAAILCDAGMDPMLIRHFAGYLSVTKEFRNIPFILLAKEMEEMSNIDIKNIWGIDDMVYYHTPIKDLLDKIALLTKYKNLRSKYPYQFEDFKHSDVSIEYLISRGVDILLSSIALILLSPVFLLVSLAIMIDSRGPIIYVSRRAGKRYKIFKFYKFRTMVVDADKKIERMNHLNQYNVGKDEKGPVFVKINNDPRVTRLGHFLRKSSIDELPQLINVLIGDMSLVGNRPLPLYEASSLTIDEAAERFLAPAGITGLWQINKRGQPDMSVQQRISLDVDYAKRHSFFLDMRILINTPKNIMQKANV